MRPFMTLYPASLANSMRAFVLEKLPEGEGADDHGRRLVRRVSADAGHDRHQRGERYQLGNRMLEEPDHARCDEGRDEVDREPRPSGS
jgi:hypothetical protein